MLPFDASEQIAAEFGRSLDDLFVSGTFGDGVQFLASFLAAGFTEDHKLADRQLQLFRGKEELERKMALMPAGDDLARARQKKQLKQLEEALHQPMDVHTPEQAQAYYAGRIDLLAQLIADLHLLRDMMRTPDQFIDAEGLADEHATD